VTFQILLNQITTLFVGLNLLTTLSFESEIKSFYYGGNKDDVYLKTTDSRTLLIKPYRVDALSNLLVVTQKRKYYFVLSYDQANPHGFIEVRHGVMNHALKKKIETTDYEILEGESSLLFINRRATEIDVNGIKVNKREYFSKGVPLLIEKKRILN
jgi:hypothetical protein